MQAEEDEKKEEVNEEHKEEKVEKEEKSNESEEEEDISTALNKEINELKAEAGKPPSEKKFQVYIWNNIIYIIIKISINTKRL